MTDRSGNIVLPTTDGATAPSTTTKKSGSTKKQENDSAAAGNPRTYADSGFEVLLNPDTGAIEQATWTK